MCMTTTMLAMAMTMTMMMMMVCHQPTSTWCTSKVCSTANYLLYCFSFFRSLLFRIEFESNALVQYRLYLISPPPYIHHCRPRSGSLMPFVVVAEGLLVFSAHKLSFNTMLRTCNRIVCADSKTK